MPHNDTDTTTGINFVNLFKYPKLYIYYSTTNQDNLQFYDNYFTQNMFKGTSLFNYWANENNPIFLLTFGIAAKTFTPEEYVQAKNETIEEMNNASPI